MLCVMGILKILNWMVYGFYFNSFSVFDSKNIYWIFNYKYLIDRNLIYEIKLIILIYYN